MELLFNNFVSTSITQGSETKSKKKIIYQRDNEALKLIGNAFNDQLKEMSDADRVACFYEFE